MNFVNTKRFLYAAALIILTIISCKNQTSKSIRQPNIIFIYSDDQRQDAAGFSGNQVIITPALDSIATKGVRFTNANVVFSLCSPSRAALLTGRYGSANGVLQLGSKLNPNEKTIAGFLKDAGYQTAISGKWHIGQTPDSVGFDFHVWFEGNGAYYNRLIHDMGNDVRPEIHCDEYCVSRSIDFLRQAAKNKKPFFLFHNTQLPHMNGKLVWNAKQITKNKYNVTEMPVATNRLDDLSNKPDYLKTVRNRTQAKVYGYPDVSAIQKHTRDYYSVITEMDDALNRLFHTLDELNVWENTYVFFMSDNGWMLGDHGFTSKVLPYRPSTRVPLFVLGHGLESDENNQIVLNIDMAPTILELAGIKIPENIQGKSIVPLLDGDNSGWRDAFVYEGLGTYGGAQPNLTVITKNFRYIVTYENDQLNKVVFRELYDQVNDPAEMVNLADDLSFSQKIKKMNEIIKMHKINVLNFKNEN
jgi:arylsulfatase A-like enzyme